MLASEEDLTILSPLIDSASEENDKRIHLQTKHFLSSSEYTVLCMF